MALTAILVCTDRLELLMNVHHLLFLFDPHSDTLPIIGQFLGTAKYLALSHTSSILRVTLVVPHLRSLPSLVTVYLRLVRARWHREELARRFNR